MSTSEELAIDLEAAAKSLLGFIREHGDDPLLVELPLTGESIKGRRIMEEEGIWFLGDWTLQGKPSGFKAIWSTDVAPGESTIVILHMKKSGNDCVIYDWDVEETF